MAGNTFGTLFRITSFGESHGPAVGGVIDGCPARLRVDFDLIERELARRRSGQSDHSSSRKEDDRVEFLSGIFEGATTGTPIAFIIRNRDMRPGDYDHVKSVYRPSHADFVYQEKYGIRDHRGGGRASARETAVRVVGGAFAKMFLTEQGINILAFVSRIGDVKTGVAPEKVNPQNIESSPVRCPDNEATGLMLKYLDQMKKEGDTAGGVVSCLSTGIPAGLGEPVFDKLNADLAKAMLSINAVKGFEMGSGFASASMKGSEHNDRFTHTEQGIKTLTNHSGGIQAGISNGADIFFRVAFKPVSTIIKDQKTVDVSGKEVVLEGKGRHDVCVVPRAVPVVEAMTAITLADHLLRFRAVRQ
ncbi:MAG: chorismate synthase [Bacteroidales bacterium]|nr:chorismate synthase [Bacteroidales bacterium]